VSQLLPRWRIIPSSLPNLTRKFFAYLTSLNLALLFLNGLPAFHLDGYHALKTLLKAKFFKFQIRRSETSEVDGEEENLPYFNSIVGITNLLLVWCMVVSTLCILI
jgi:S2P endopeptidase